jgi:hypothetical protein
MVMGVSERRACRVLGQPRSTQRYISVKPEGDAALVAAMDNLRLRYKRSGGRVDLPRFSGRVSSKVCSSPPPAAGRTQAEAQPVVFDFIEGWYNPRRRHSALGYLSPVVFERRQSELGIIAHGERAEMELPAVAGGSAAPALLTCCAGEASDSRVHSFGQRLGVRGTGRSGRIEGGRRDDAVHRAG